MALALNVSNSLEKLAGRLAADLAAFPGDVFQPDFIITQTTGMNSWLKQQLAGYNGIAANIRFVKPNDILYQVYFKLDGPREKVLAADNLQWLIFTELDNPLFKKRYPWIAGYYENGDELKRLGLAQKVGDLFDQYQIYRPELIREWNKSSLSDTSLHWQAWLWVRSREVLGAQMPDKTLIADYIGEALNDPARRQQLCRRLPRVHLFGISILTAFHIDLFRQLSDYIDICFYLLNPSPELYWYEDRSPQRLARWHSRQGASSIFAPPVAGNALLTNWGEVIQDTFSLMFRHEEFLDRYDEAGTEVPAAGSLLQKIQLDLFSNAVGDDRQSITAEDLSDGSLCFNACYTPAREVEALYNYLAGLVEEGILQSPREVIVMVSDINAYAPYIRAVFSAAPYTFPFMIADESITASQGFFSALQAVMNLNAEDFKAEDILQLLELDHIRDRFSISRPELVRKAVSAANIRFGISGETEDESVTLSWENGLKRILYGICMISPDEYVQDGYGFYPLDIAEGEPALELVRFAHLVQVLISVSGEQERYRTLAEWSDYLSEAAARLLLTPENNDDPDELLFRQYLERLNVLSETMPEKISFKVFRQSFINEMASETRPGNFIGGGITFCSLIPMRSIPFKTVAMLGLNFDQFPRKEVPVTFDLIKARPRAGDRDVRENDKHLFLETLLSAKERLYISYVGRNAKDNSVRPPSALVDELLDYLTDEPAALVHTHPLHSFSSRYADPGSGLVTYLGDTEPPARDVALSVAPKALNFTEIDISGFVSFFKNPFKAYYNKVLDIYYREDPLLLGDTEVFELGHLEQWGLKHALLFIEEGELPAYRDKGVKTGTLPLRNMADLTLEATFENISEFRELARACTAGQERSTRYLSVPFDGAVLTGTISPVYGNKLVLASFSGNESKYCLEAYILHLLIMAGGVGLDTHYLSAASLEEIVLPAGRLAAADATEELRLLLALYKQGHETPLAYSPDFKISMADLAGMSHQQFMAAVSKATGERGWVSDPYVLREIDHGAFEEESFLVAFKRNAASVYGPVETIFNR